MKSLFSLKCWRPIKSFKCMAVNCNKILRASEIVSHGLEAIMALNQNKKYLIF